MSGHVLTDSFWIVQLAMKKVECTCIYMLLTHEVFSKGWSGTLLNGGNVLNNLLLHSSYTIIEDYFCFL